VCDGAVMLDLSAMKALRVDPETRRVRAGPGLTLGEFDRATQAFRLATTLGVVSTTGIAGLTLGGGLGWLNGRHGLACDNLISAEVATATSGSSPPSSTNSIPSTSSWPGSPRSRSRSATAVRSPRANSCCARCGGSRRRWTTGSSPCPWKSGWLREVTDGAIETLMRFLPQMPSRASGVGLQQLHGAASRVAPSAAAFPHRAEQYDFLIGSQWSDAADSDRNLQWTRALFEAMRPHLEESVYVNNLGDEGPRRVQAAYGENGAR
jgi:hypothetical protein